MTPYDRTRGRVRYSRRERKREERRYFKRMRGWLAHQRRLKALA